MSEAKHSALPWSSEYDETGHWRVYGGDKLVADVGNAEAAMAADIEWKANAALIVRAVNAHDDLVAALRGVRNEISREIVRGDGIFSDEQLAAIDRALAKAKTS